MFFHIKLPNMALNVPFGYYFAIVVNVLAQFTSNEMSVSEKWVNN